MTHYASNILLVLNKCCSMFTEKDLQVATETERYVAKIKSLTDEVSSLKDQLHNTQVGTLLLSQLLGIKYNKWNIQILFKNHYP